MGWFKRKERQERPKRQVDVGQASVVIECIDSRYEVWFEGEYLYRHPLGSHEDVVVSARDRVRKWMLQANETGLVSVGPRETDWLEYVPLRKVEKVSVRYESYDVEVDD